MDQKDLIREAAQILDRGAQNLMRVLLIVGIRVTPATAEKIRGVLAASIAEGISLGERYAQWRRGHVRNPYPKEDVDEDLIDTRPIRKSSLPPKPKN